MTEEENHPLVPISELDDDHPIMKLEDKYRAFLFEYTSNGYNHIKAGEACGVPKGKCLWVTRDKDFKEAVKWVQSQEATELTISKDFVVQEYKRVIEEAKESGKTADLKHINKALENLSKIMGYDAPKKTETTVTGQITHTHDDELEEALKRKLEELHRDSAITVTAHEIKEIE